jgi:amino acid adenylation domain-containing protein
MPVSNRQFELSGVVPLTTEEFLAHLQSLGIELTGSNGKLKLTAPVGVLSDELQAELRERKPELLALLCAHDDPNEERRAPLTFAQQRLWLIDRFSSGTIAYNIPQSWTVEAYIDRRALQLAIDRLAERHQALRTQIELRNGEAFQVVLRRVSIPLGFTDLSAEGDGTLREERVNAILAWEGRQPFALDKAPLIRFHCVRIAANRSVVCYTMHHIISDQWSLNILKRDVAALYMEALIGQPAQLPAITLQYADIALSQRSEAAGRLHEIQMEYWRERLREVPPLLELPFSGSRPPEATYAGATLSITLEAALTGQLRLLAVNANTSLYFLMLSVFALLLHRYTGQSDLCIGTPITARKLRDEEELIGLFVNMLPLRCIVDRRESFDALVRRTSNAVLNDFEHGDVPFQKLVTELHRHRSSAYSPLFQMMFALNPNSSGENEGQQETYINISKFDLTLQISEKADTFDAFFEYRTDLFTHRDIERFSEHFVSLCKSLTMNPMQAVGTLDILTEQDRQSLETWNATALEFDRLDTLFSLFVSQVHSRPNSIALCCGEATYTFDRLHRRVEVLAQLLTNLGAKRGNFVAVCLDRSPELIISILAILKSGAAYLPLDPKYPEDRLAYMLEDSGARVMVTERSPASERILARYPTLRVHFVEDDAVALNNPRTVPPAVTIQPEDPAYVIYTSGSTGKPKGVVVEHKNAVALMAWAARSFAPESLRGVLASTSICFDLSIFEVFLPLSTGNTIVLVDDVLELSGSPNANRVTLVNTVPSAMNVLLESRLPASVQTVCMAGEFLPTELVDRVYAAGVAEVFDLYGPTETTTYSTFTLRARGAAATIGKPIGNTRIYLLDEAQRQVPPGAVGEIFIAGEGVTRGYLNRPDLTAERFVVLPAIEAFGRLYRTGDLARQLDDGSLVYQGRLDNQIKLRGHRIELGEIEEVLREVTGALQLAVVLQKRDAGDTLVAFVAVEPPVALDTSDIVAALRRRLPSYMIPAQIEPLRSLPLTPNGKIDRKKLSTLVKQESERVGEMPRDLLEQWLANIWSHRLGKKYIARDADFFDDLGGHSLVAFEIFAEIEKRLGLAMMLATLFQSPTVERLAQDVRQHTWIEPKSIELLEPGWSDQVLYWVGEPTEAKAFQRDFPGTRVMAVKGDRISASVASQVAEIAAFEVVRRTLIVGARRSHAEKAQELVESLTRSGFVEVSLRIVD